jgi:hypothetical protein
VTAAGSDEFRGELVPDDVSPRDLADEANYRARQAGYPVTRDGRPEPRPPQALCNWGPRRLNVWRDRRPDD